MVSDILRYGSILWIWTPAITSRGFDLYFDQRIVNTFIKTELSLKKVATIGIDIFFLRASFTVRICLNI